MPTIKRERKLVIERKQSDKSGNITYLRPLDTSPSRQTNPRSRRTRANFQQRESCWLQDWSRPTKVKPLAPSTAFFDHGAQFTETTQHKPEQERAEDTGHFLVLPHDALSKQGDKQLHGREVGMTSDMANHRGSCRTPTIVAQFNQNCRKDIKARMRITLRDIQINRLVLSYLRTRRSELGGSGSSTRCALQAS